MPGLFERTIFSGGPAPVMSASRFIRAMHPKAELPPTREAIKKVLSSGWWGQLKIHGHRAQLHIPSADDGAACDIVAYNRHGKPHQKLLPPDLAQEVWRIFRPQSGWTVIDAEWLKGDDRLFVFDILKRADVLLDDWTYAERFELLPRVYASPKIETLPPLKTLDACMKALESPHDYVEGLVFKATTTRGFLDSSIVRCRR
jgi:hypothetical protein